MSEASVTVAGGETRQAMIRVWMAISAIWIVFWLCIAAPVVIAGAEIGKRFAQEPH